MSSARTLIRQHFLVLLEYCSLSKAVLQYQYQGSSIVLQYKTGRLVHPWRLPLNIISILEIFIEIIEYRIVSDNLLMKLSIIVSFAKSSLGDHRNV
jgi:hypothetical protein